MWGADPKGGCEQGSEKPGAPGAAAATPAGCCSTAAISSTASAPAAKYFRFILIQFLQYETFHLSFITTYLPFIQVLCSVGLLNQTVGKLRKSRHFIARMQAPLHS